MKLTIFTILATLFTACGSLNTTKIVNGSEQTFVQYVVLNEKSEWEGSWNDLEAESFPLNRLQKWLEADENKRGILYTQEVQ